MGKILPQLSRRGLVSGLAGLGAVTIIGCSRSPQSGQTPGNAAAADQPTARLASMTVYRDPSCGCCETWAAIARQADYQVSVVDRPDMPAIKARLGVPDSLSSCHTTIVRGYVVEGHVPLSDVTRLLDEKPNDIRGIAVARMPRGSPGMEIPDGSKDAFQVMAFDAAGNTSIFKAYRRAGQ